MIREEESLTGAIVGAALEPHRELGPGLLESVYQLALGDELRARGLRVQRQYPVSFEFRGRV